MRVKTGYLNCAISLAATLAGSIYLVAANAGTIVQFPTSMGSYFVQLNDPGPTATVTNFQNYVDNGKYDNTLSIVSRRSAPSALM
jgi:hypothetical protein